MLASVAFHCDADKTFRDPLEKVRAFTFYDYSIALHTHDFYEINIVMSGSGTHQVSENAISVQEGDVFIIPPMVPHAYYDTERLEVVHILIRPEVIQSNLSEARKVDGFLLFTEIEPALRISYSSPQVLRLSPIQLRSLDTDLAVLRDDSPYNKRQSSPLIIHTMWKLVYMFSVCLANQVSAKSGRSSKYEKQIIEALQYIHKNYHKKITIETLLKRVYMSRSTFLRSFAEVTGVTPLQYISRYRLDKALLLLEDKALSKSEVARLCGYYNSAHLDRALK